MAEIEYTHDMRGESGMASGGTSLGKAINVMGAVASLALVVGVGFWGYKLVIRDVSGVPVVRALEGPMRVQPDDPGGLPADHQGLSVNAVAADGVAAKPADELKLAPRPVDLTEDDVPMGELTSAEPVAPRESVGLVSLTETATSEAAAQASTEASIDALVRQLTTGVQPLEPLAEVAKPEQSAAARIEQPTPLESARPEDAALVEPAVLKGPGLPSSLRPKPRPARADTAARAPASQSPSAIDVDPDSLPLGTRLAQLGAFDSPEIARAEWDRLSASFSDYFTGKSRVIQQASSGGRTFYRLRAMGFDDLSEARRFCSVLVADNTDCIPVTTR